MLLLVEISESQAENIIKNIRHAIIDQPIHPPQGGRVNLTISAGICLFDGHPDYERLIKRADGALYLAKKNGRNRTEIYRAAAGETDEAGEE